MHPHLSTCRVSRDWDQPGRRNHTANGYCCSIDEEDASSGLEESSTDILAVSVLRGSRVLPRVVNILADTAEMHAMMRNVVPHPEPAAAPEQV